MPLTTPSSASEVIDRAVNDVFLALQAFGAKPSLRNSWLNALIVAYSNRIFDFYYALDQAALEALPDTAVDNLERWAAIWGIRRTPGTRSNGDVVIQGTVGSAIPALTILTDGAGLEYRTRFDATITTKSGIPLSLTSDGLGTATATWIFDANSDLTPLIDGDLITVTGATQTEYNVINAPVTVLSALQFTFPISGTPASPATGSPVGAWTNTQVETESVEFLEDADADGYAALTFESPIVGVNETAFVNALGLNGGADQETLDALRTRLLDRIQNPVAHFNVADIRARALTVPGVTRVFVFEITPGVGQVTIYFMRDLDATGAIPSGTEIDEVKTELDLIRPANTAPEDLIVLAPTAVATDFDFATLLPNTSSMKTAVKLSLAEFFRDRPTLGEAVSEDQYRSAIFNTVDPESGDRVESFSLNSPSGPIPIVFGEIATLGNITGI